MYGRCNNFKRGYKARIKKELKESILLLMG